MIYVFSPNVLAPHGKTRKLVHVIAIDDDWNVYYVEKDEEIYFHPLQKNPPESVECHIVQPNLKGKSGELRTNSTRGKGTKLLRTVAGSIISSTVKEDKIDNALHNFLSKRGVTYSFNQNPDQLIKSTPNLITTIFQLQDGEDFDVLRKEEAQRLSKLAEIEAKEKARRDRLEARKTPVGKIELWDRTVGPNDDKYQWTRYVREDTYKSWLSKVGTQIIKSEEDWDLFLANTGKYNRQVEKEGNFRVIGTLRLEIQEVESSWWPWSQDEYTITVQNSRS